MTRFLLYILLPVQLIATLFTTGCSDSETTRQLNRAEALMEEHPDSVCALLDGVDSLRLSKVQGALYGVLDAQSRHKLHLAAPSSDSLLNLAVDRYASAGPDSMLMKAHFYRAVYREAGNDVESGTRDAITAYELASEQGNHYWQAKSAELVGDFANTISNYKEEAKWRRIAANNYKNAGKVYNHLTALCDLASAYLNMHDSIRAMSLVDTLHREVARHPDDTDLHGYYAYTAVFVNNAYGPVERTDSLYELLNSLGYGIEMDPAIGLVKANVLLQRGDYQKSLNVLDSTAPHLAMLQERSMAYGIYYRLAYATRDMDLMRSAADSLLSVQLRLISGALDQPVTSTQRDYFETKAVVKGNAHRRAVRVVWWIIGGSIILIGCGYMAYRIRMKRKERQLREKIDTIQAITAQLEEETEHSRIIESEFAALKDLYGRLENALTASQTSEEGSNVELEALKKELKQKGKEITKRDKLIAGMNHRISGMYAERWQPINMLCKEFIQKGKKADAIIMANINAELDKLKTPAFLRALENEIDSCMDGAATKLRKVCQQLKEEDIKVGIWSLAGFSINAMSLFTGVAASTLYKRKDRVYREIMQSAAKETQNLLEYWR